MMPMGDSAACGVTTRQLSPANRPSFMAISRPSSSSRSLAGQPAEFKLAQPGFLLLPLQVQAAKNGPGDLAADRP